MVKKAIMAIYAVHPSGGVTSIQLATLYGLTNPADYIVVDDSNPPAGFKWHEYINLYVREGGGKGDKGYQSIKYELGDERDGVQRYQGGNLWREVRTSVERKKRTGEDKY